MESGSSNRVLRPRHPLCVPLIDRSGWRLRRFRHKYSAMLYQQQQAGESLAATGRKVATPDSRLNRETTKVTTLHRLGLHETGPSPNGRARPTPELPRPSPGRRLPRKCLRAKHSGPPRSKTSFAGTVARRCQSAERRIAGILRACLFSLASAVVFARVLLYCSVRNTWCIDHGSASENPARGSTTNTSPSTNTKGLFSYIVLDMV